MSVPLLPGAEYPTPNHAAIVVFATLAAMLRVRVGDIDRGKWPT